MGHTTAQKLEIFCSIAWLCRPQPCRDHSVPILYEHRDTTVQTEEQGRADNTPIFLFYLAGVLRFCFV